MLKLWIIILFIQYSLNTQKNPRKKGFVEGDLMIGALFSIHEQPTLKGTYTRECGDIREQYGMHRVEVLLKTIKEINDRSDILPGMKLGVDIRDTCWYAPIALEQSIDFIKNSISYQEKSESNISQPIVGLIGPAASEVTTQVQNLLQLFKIPQIGFSATSIDLSSKNSYRYFMRVVPSDKLQVTALIDLLNYFKWNFISLLSSKGSYGENGINELQERLKNYASICIDQKLDIDNKEEEPRFKSVALDLFTKGKAKVVICFCQGDTAKKLLRAMKELNMTKKGYLIIGTDGWADRTDILGDDNSDKKELSEAALGSITIRLYSPLIPGFENYFNSKTYENTAGNPWFQEYWEKKFTCNFDQSKPKKYNKSCTGKESLFNMAYKEDSKLGFVVKSVMTIARGLHNIYLKNCSLNKEKCKRFIPNQGELLLKEMLQLSFVGYDNETVSFSPEGDPPGRYEIMNYQYSYSEKDKRHKYQYKKIGSWKDNNLKINRDLIQWPISDGNSGSNRTQIQSYCSAPCKIGEIRVGSKVGKLCCWTCQKCDLFQFINKTDHVESCVFCPNGYQPTKNRTGCKEIPPIFVQWSDALSIMAILFSCIGISITIAITLVFIKFHNTPVVKSSTRELMYVILAGILLSYLTAFPLICKPSFFTCLLTRIMPGLSFSLIFGSLVTKTNRICRILSISKKKIVRRKGRFLTTTAQMVIVLILNVVEIAVISTMIFYQPPDLHNVHPTRNQTYLLCNTAPSSLFISMGFDAFLICLCTWYAFKTRNLPENFNEAKFIGFTMYTTCIVWIGLVVIYLSTKLLAIPLCYAINVTATICIVLLFMPKIYIILFKPEKNERAAFTTTTEIRCHIGSGKTEYECSKDKSDRRKSYTNQNTKTPTDLRKCSDFVIRKGDHATDKISLVNLDNKFQENCFPKTTSDKETKLTQTEVSLLIEFLLDLSDSFEGNIDEPSKSQMALLQFLKDNWSKDHIPQLLNLGLTDKGCLEMLSPVEKFLDDDQISDTVLDDTDNDNSSIKHPMIAQSNSVLTCSPISNASTNASSTITSLFLEYLLMRGKQFETITDKKSVKL